MKPTLDRQGDFVSLEETRSAGGLLRGSLIMTAQGERPIHTLRPGDRVISRDRGMIVLEDIRTRQVDTSLVRIAARSLGHNRPEQDSTLPAGQRILIRDWRAQAIFGTRQALVAAERLVDGEFITRLPTARITVFDLLFDDPHILYVDGLEVVSYIDDYAFF